MSKCHPLGRAVAAIACIAAAACVICGCTCRPISEIRTTSIRSLGVGDRISVHLSDGRIVNDRFVLVTDDVLECKLSRFPISEVDCVQRRAPRHLVEGIAIGAALVGIMILSLMGPWGPLAS